MHHEPARLYLCPATDSPRNLPLARAGNFVCFEEPFYRSGDLHDMCLDGKVARVEEADLRVGNVFTEGLCSGGNKEWVVLTPNGQQRRFRLTEILLKFRIKLHVRCVS